MFSENLAYFVFLLPSFKICRFAFYYRQFFRPFKYGLRQKRVHEKFTRVYKELVLIFSVYEREDPETNFNNTYL